MATEDTEAEPLFPLGLHSLALSKGRKCQVSGDRCLPTAEKFLISSGSETEL